MKMFGAGSPKPTWLYSNYKWINGIDVHAIKSKTEALQTPNIALVKKYKDRSGAAKIVGNDQLKCSQAYPRGFAEAVARLHEEHEHELRTGWVSYQDVLDRTCLEKADFSTRGKSDRWDDASLAEVFGQLL
jgi:hypothetical protein